MSLTHTTALWTILWFGSTTSPLVGQLRDEAYVGEPFGVARIRVAPRGADDSPVVRTDGYAVDDPSGRVVYPAFAIGGPAAGLLRQAMGEEATSGAGPLTVYFLFRGSQPLEFTVAAPAPQRVRVDPANRPRAHARLLRAWWRHYSAAAQQQTRQGDYPPLVETYLTTVLGQRLGLEPPLLGRLLDPQRSQSTGRDSLLVLLNAESMHLQALEQSLSTSRMDTGPADQPVPEDIAWSPREIPAAATTTPLEPIASHVPEECFYVRFGSFDNYLWLRHLMDDFGGDIGRMITARGQDAGISERLENQLGLKETTLARLLGGQVIADVALIGCDTYVGEGAAVGILFQARNSALLQNDLMTQRREAVARAAQAGATMTSVDVAGQSVSLASSPDNRLRSFYIAQGPYHLVTTSRAIVARFCEAAQGIRPLDATAEFRLARQTLPLDRDDTVFAYLSPAFFRGLMSPQYQIELRRRMRAVTDLQVLQLAQWAAKVEGSDSSLTSLVRAGLLPRNIEQRPDGSHPVPRGDQWVDEPRGARGTFVPIPDMELRSVTPAEAAQYQQIAAFHRNQWDHMDPLIVTLKRFSLEQEGRERLRIEARMLPFDRQKYGLVTSIVGPPSQVQLRLAAEDIASIQLVLQGGLLRPNVGPHLLFLGLRDVEVPLDLGRRSLLRTLLILRAAPAYLGAWPMLGLLDLLPLGTAPDSQGYSQLPLGLWRRQTPEGLSLLSFDQSILASTLPQLAIERADYPAQVRVRIGDLSQAKIRSWLNALHYQRAYETSVGNTRMLHALSQQLGVSREQAREAAESLLGMKLVCALGGEYQLRDEPDGLPCWVSTAWPDAPQQAQDAKPEFTAPWLPWFRGLEADVVMLQDRVIAYAALDMQRRPQSDPPGLKLPLFELLKDNPFKRPNKEAAPATEEPFEELPPPPPASRD